MLKGIWIGSAAALTAGAVLAAAAASIRLPAPAARDSASAPARGLKITLAAPKEPVHPPGPLLPTVPAGANSPPEFSRAPLVQPYFPPPQEARGAETDDAYDAYDEYEPTFPDEDELAELELEPGGRYFDGGPRWRERRGDRHSPQEPYFYREPPPSPWWPR